jgi:hypothetical protein
VVSYRSLLPGATIYAGANTETNCSVVPDGWYFLPESVATGTVYNVVGGVIASLGSCFTTTTTTSTATPCNSYTAVKTTVGIVAVTYVNCSGVASSINVGNAEGGPSSVTFCARCCPNTPSGVSLTNNGLC